MKPKKIESWEKIREKGAWRYGFIYGSAWGLFVIAFLVVINFFTNKEQGQLTVPHLLMWVAVYIPVGILLYRFFMWRVNENNYQKWLEQQGGNEKK